MLVITMAHQNRATNDPARSGVYQDDSSLSNRARMAYPSHVAAGTGTLLYAGNVAMTSGPGGTRMGRFR